MCVHFAWVVGVVEPPSLMIVDGVTGMLIDHSLGLIGDCHQERIALVFGGFFGGDVDRFAALNDRLERHATVDLAHQAFLDSLNRFDNSFARHFVAIQIMLVMVGVKLVGNFAGVVQVFQLPLPVLGNRLPKELSDNAAADRANSHADVGRIADLDCQLIFGVAQQVFAQSFSSLVIVACLGCAQVRDFVERQLSV